LARVQVKSSADASASKYCGDGGRRGGAVGVEEQPHSNAIVKNAVAKWRSFNAYPPRDPALE
jgi:hypothetical protein